MEGFTTQVCASPRSRIVLGNRTYTFYLWIFAALRREKLKLNHSDHYKQQGIKLPLLYLPCFTLYGIL